MSLLRKAGYHPNMTKEQARHLSSSNNYRRLGSGQSTIAFEVIFDVVPEISWSAMADAYSAMQAMQVTRESRVIRVSSNETGMRTTIAIAMRHQDDPLAPKIYDTMELQDGFLCVMERLTPCNYNNPAPKAGLFTGCGHPSARGLETSAYLREIDEVTRSLAGISYDTHEANFAMRGNQVVYLDPLYCSRWDGPLPQYRDKNYRAPRPMTREFRDHARDAMMRGPDRLVRNRARDFDALQAQILPPVMLDTELLKALGIWPAMKTSPVKGVKPIDSGLLARKREADAKRKNFLSNLNPVPKLKGL